MIQLASVIITGEIANYRYYDNFDLTDAVSVADFYGWEAFFLIIGLVLSTLVIHFMGRILHRYVKRRSVAFFMLLTGIVVLSTSGGIINQAYSTLQLKFAGDTSFSEALVSLGIDGESYPEKDEIEASEGKNIVVLSLESLEAGYLEGKLKHLTPNLSRLADQYTFYKMDQAPAAGWTSASMYTTITGVPAFFGIHGNSIFQKSYENKIITLSDVLKKADYDIQYFLGKKEFSGINDMLETHGFTVKSEKDFETQYEKVPWGIQDKDLFTEFRKELLVRKEAGKPFALFLSSISTHFPDGMPDKRMDSLFPPQKSQLELMAMATDHLVGELIDFLKEEGMLDNTVFYIYPDHLLMGRKSRVLEDFDKRSLYLITNAEASTLSYSTDNKINQIDLPKIILEGAEVDHNVKFLTDFISDKNKNKFLKKNDKILLQLNEAALKTLNCKEGIYITRNIDQSEFEIRNKEGMLVLSGDLPPRGSFQRVFFDQNLRPFRDVVIASSRNVTPPKADAYLDIFVTGTKLYACMKGKYDFGITKNGDVEVVFDTADLALIDNIQLEEDVQNYMLLSSNSWDAKKPSSFTIQGKKITITRGLTVISFNSKSEDGYEYRTFDTHSNEADVEDFMEVLEALINNGGQFIILGHDSVIKGLQEELPKIKSLGLSALSNVLGRQAYVMHNLEGGISEKVDSLTVNMELAYPGKITNDTEYFGLPEIPFEPDVNRYIAHAGGEIDGARYTNSKEALDVNYSKGFRLFELDIIETSDNFLVAAHDWKHWAKETKTRENGPVTREEFLKHKIRGKYTPLDMERINEWFSEHPDAILVTDKVNTPGKFASEFVDRTRLRMELFSLSAVKEAASLGVSAMISYAPLQAIEGDKIAFLKENRVGYVAMSRRLITKELTLLKRLRENDIKVFVYHVNFDPGKTEQYVQENEIGLVYGMYADRWLPEFQPDEIGTGKR